MSALNSQWLMLRHACERSYSPPDSDSRLLGCRAYFRKINYTPYGEGIRSLNVSNAQVRIATAQPACSSGHGKGWAEPLGAQVLEGSQVVASRVPSPPSPYQPPPRKSHLNVRTLLAHCQEGPGLGPTRGLGGPGAPLGGFCILESDGGSPWGRLPCCPFGQQACLGTRAGSQAPLAPG